MKAYASGGRNRGGQGRIGRTPQSPTSVQGRFYQAGGRTSLTSSMRGRGREINYVPRRGR